MQQCQSLYRHAWEHSEAWYDFYTDTHTSSWLQFSQNKEETMIRWEAKKARNHLSSVYISLFCSVAESWFDGLSCDMTLLFSTPASDGFSQCCLWRWFFDDSTFVNWLFCWSRNYTIQHMRWCVMIRHLWWFALSTFHEESARAVSTWYLQAGALNPEDRRRTNGPTMACFGRDQVLRIISSYVCLYQTHLYFVVLDVTRSISGAMSISDCDPCLPGRFSVLDVLGNDEFLKMELQNLRLRWSDNIPCFISDCKDTCVSAYILKQLQYMFSHVPCKPLVVRRLWHKDNWTPFRAHTWVMHDDYPTYLYCIYKAR